MNENSAAGPKVDEAALVAQLSRRGAEALARFIVTLAHDQNGTGEYVRNFIAADDLPQCIARIESTVDAVAAGEREYAWRHARDEIYLRRLDHVLDAIELIVLPVDPHAAFKLLVRVIESDEAVENLLHEAYTAPTFSRACDLLRRAARELPAIETEPVIERLLHNDDYGHRKRVRVSGDAAPQGVER